MIQLWNGLPHSLWIGLKILPGDGQTIGVQQVAFDDQPWLEVKLRHAAIDFDVGFNCLEIFIRFSGREIAT